MTGPLPPPLAAKKAELDRLLALAPHGTQNLEHSQDLELTWSSNAIEGNTLTAVLRNAQAGPASAFEAHRRLVAIHPFNDGNGRTARLLMNLLLIRSGYPAVAIRPADRAEYVAALQHAQQPGGPAAPFDSLLARRLDATLDEFLRAANDAVA